MRAPFLFAFALCACSSPAASSSSAVDGGPAEASAPLCCVLTDAAGNVTAELPMGDCAPPASPTAGLFSCAQGGALASCSSCTPGGACLAYQADGGATGFLVACSRDR